MLQMLGYPISSNLWLAFIIKCIKVRIVKLKLLRTSERDKAKLKYCCIGGALATGRYI